MSLTTTTHLNFRGDARAALEFYRSVFGGELTLMTYAEAHNVQDPDEADQIMWGQVAAEDGFRVMAYDVPSGTDWSAGEIPFFVSVRASSAEEIADRWARLSSGATIVAALAPAPWTALYGMLKDRFGVTWALDVEAGRAAS